MSQDKKIIVNTAVFDLDNKYSNYETELDEISLTAEQNLQFKNFNLQVILADKNIENLELKKNILSREKEEVISKILDLKRKLAKEHSIDINKYEIDLINKKLIKKSET